MNKAMKIALISSGSIILAGLILFGIVWIYANSTGLDRDYAGREADMHTELIGNNIKNITLNLSNATVDIIRGGTELTLEHNISREGNYTITSDEKSFTFSRPVRRGFFRWVDMSLIEDLLFPQRDSSQELRRIIITVPETINLESLSIFGYNVVANIENQTLSNLLANGANSTVNINNSYAEVINVSGANTELNTSFAILGRVNLSGANFISTVKGNSEISYLDLSGVNAEMIVDASTIHEADISGVNVTVEMIKSYTSNMDISGVNAQATLELDNISEWGFETAGVNSSLTVDGQRSNFKAGERMVTATGVNASIKVTTSGN